MKHTKLCMLIVLIFGLSTSSDAQILKGFGKKLEKKIEQRIERAADRQVDKALDKAEQKTEESVSETLSSSKSTEDSKAKDSSGSTAPAVAQRPDQAMLLFGSSCADFSWFKKGAELAYEALDAKGKVQGGIAMKVIDLKNQGSKTIAHIDATMSSKAFDDISYPMNYICDGDKIYMDIASMMKAMMEKNPDMKNQAVQDAFENMEINVDEGFASFPKSMYPGMELENLSFSFKTSVAGNEMSFQTTVSERQVVAKEKVTTPAGTFDCLKIRSVNTTSLQIMGMNQSMPATTELLWIAPGVGMVKQETSSKDEVTTMQLKAYKM